MNIKLLSKTIFGLFLICAFIPSKAGNLFVEKKLIKNNTEITSFPTAVISGTTTVCQNSSQPPITFTGSGGTAPYTFTYSINGVVQPTITTLNTDDSVSVLAKTTTLGTFIYKLISVKDATNNTSPQAGTATVIVNSAPDASIGGTGSGTVINGVAVFRTCINASSTFTFTNTSTTTSINTNYTIQWGDGSPDFVSSSWASTTHTYPIGLWNLILTVEGNNGCSTSQNYTVFVGSNPAVALGNPGNTDICIGDSLTFPITGTKNNPPGTIYTVTFNDGSLPEVFNHPPPASITHVFPKKSCGTTSSDGSNTYPNSFTVNIVATNPCSSSSVGVVPIYVSALPVAKFSGPSKACINTQVCFTNTSEGFQVVGGICYEPNKVWSISPATGYTISNASNLGNDFGSDDASLWQSGSDDLCITFNVAGTYSITIKSGSKCGLNDYTDTETRTICIEPAITPQFTTSIAEGCSPLDVKTTNTTSLIDQCSPLTYQWTVTYASGNCGNNSNFNYINGTNANSTEANFNFVESGNYSISLSTNNSCGSKSKSQTVIIKKPPTVSINSISDICQTSATSTINPKALVTNCAPSSSTMTYSWSFPGGIPATSTNANPGIITYNSTGNYTVSLSVTNECGTTVASSKSFTIYPLPVISGNLSTCVNATSQLSASISGNNNSWNASPSGIVSISKTGLVTGLAAGTTTITYTDKNGCATNAIFTVNAIPTATISGDKTICANASAQIVMTGTNGVAPYTFTYNINNGPNKTISSGTGSTAILTVPTDTAGIFTYNLISVSDTSTTGCVNNQTGSATITINAIPTIALQPLASQKICIGGTIAPLTASYIGGAGTVTYQWYKNTNNSSTGGTLITGATNDTYLPPTFNTAGTFYYYVVVSLSASGCGSVNSLSAEVIVAPDPTIIKQPLTPQTLCQGSTPMSLTVEANSGTGEPLNYQWYSNNFNSNIGGTIIAGATDYTYVPSTNLIGTQYYYCVISQVGLGCEVISKVAAVNILTGPSIITQPQSSSVCEGGTPTKLTVAYTNGTGTPSYQWYSNNINSNSGGTAINGATSSAYTPPASTKGIVYYYCEITFSSGGCNNLISDTAQVEINQGLNINSRTITICSGESFTIIPDNSNGDIVPAGTTYTWNYPKINPLNAVTGASSKSSPQNNIFQTLVNTSKNPATVVYTVKPSAGICFGNDFTITVIVNPPIEVNAIITNSTCNNLNNGVIKTNITGGTPVSVANPYNIAWSGPNGFIANNADISGLAPGIYNLSIDAGCTFSNSYTITEPTAIILKTDAEKDITCFGDADGHIAITVSGGTKPYSYNWTKNNVPFANTEDISNLEPGTYKVSVSDANSCGPIINSFTITEPQPLSVSLVNQTTTLCYGNKDGAITIITEGGTPIQIALGVFDYHYSWTGPNGFVSNQQNLTNLQAGTYHLDVTDNSGCTQDLTVIISQTKELILTATTTPITCYGSNNASISVNISGGNPNYEIAWSNLANGLTQNNLSPGDYTITVTDAFGCTKQLTINIQDVPVFSVNPVVKNISCHGANDGSIALNFAGGSSGIKLVWSDGINAGTTRNNLAPGTYKVTINNGSPCQIERTFVIIEPQELQLNATLSQPNACSNTESGIINLSVSGGTPYYTYSWSNGSTNEDLTRVVAGNYYVKIKDINGCTIESQYTLKNTDPIALDVETNIITDCSNVSASQKFEAKVNGGVPPYKYSWANGTISKVDYNIPSFSTTENGIVNLLVSDSSGCTAKYSQNVVLPEFGYPNFENNSVGYSTYGVFSINDPIEFKNTTSGDFESIVWDFGDGTFSTETNPVHTYSIPKDYVVLQTVNYPYGCSIVNKITLVVEKGYLLVVPTAFTPNNDTVNDTYRPVTRALKNVQMDVYDTWGSLIYSENGDSLRGWDGIIKGSQSENGNYYCKVTGETFYGSIVNESTPFVLIK